MRNHNTAQHQLPLAREAVCIESNADHTDEYYLLLRNSQRQIGGRRA
jgi:hypothetical protein